MLNFLRVSQHLNSSNGVSMSLVFVTSILCTLVEETHANFSFFFFCSSTLPSGPFFLPHFLGGYC